MIKRSDHQVFQPLYFKELLRLRPRRACEFACFVLAGTSEELASLRVLGARCGVAVPSDLARSFLVKIFHCSEGGNVEQVARTSK